jgi:hypothetical protein
MALAGCSSFIHNMGHQLYSDEKGAAVIFSVSAGFPQNIDCILMSVACGIAHYLKVQ